MNEKLAQIKRSWQQGRPILLFDNEKREGEVDIMLPSIKMTPEVISQMRNDAGGLICAALSHEICEDINLPFMADIYESVVSTFPLLEQMLVHGLPYGAKSSFSVNVNHVDAFTGITDNDRSLTINELGAFADKTLATEGRREYFSSKFRLPGHVPLLRGAPGLLKNRLGHTELGLALCELTGFSASICMCEMMSDTGDALSLADAKDYAEKHNLPYIDGEEVIRLYSQVKGISSEEIYSPSWRAV